jgi:predicted nucleotidyltransferase
MTLRRQLFVGLELQQETLIAQVQGETLGRSLLIALVVISPYAIYKMRQVRLVRRAHDAVLAAEAAPPPPDTAPLPALEDVIRDISYVVTEAKLNGGAILVIPSQVTVSHREANDAIVDLLVSDALRRSGLVIASQESTEEGRLVHCVLAEASE